MLLIHVGFYRTASTFLQKKIFPLIDKDFNFENNLKISVERIVYPESLKFDEKKIRRILRDYVSIQKIENKIKVFSYEHLSGHPFSGGRNQNEILERVKKTFPSALILLIFREQQDHIKSMYKKYIKDGGKRNIDYFLNKRLSIHSVSFAKSYLNYFDLIIKYQELFGKNRVLALPYEMLKYSPNSFIKKISSFLGSNLDYKKIKFEIINKSSSKGYYEFERIINNFYKSDPIVDLNQSKSKNKKFSNFIKNKINVIIPKYFLNKFELKLENKIESFCNDYFCENNKKLQKQVGINLKRYGYKL